MLKGSTADTCKFTFIFMGNSLLETDLHIQKPSPIFFYGPIK